MFCSKCGQELSKDVTFFSACGYQVGTVVTAVRRGLGWSSRTRRKVWWAIGIAWLCGVLFFGLLHVPMKMSSDRLGYNFYGDHPTHDQSSRVTRATIFKLGRTHSKDFMTTEQGFVDWRKWLFDLLHVTLPALALFGATFVPRVIPESNH